MIKRDMPPAYYGREQAYIKHTILKSYLRRLFMIIGRSKEPVINYVDCFSGPWNQEDEALRDTSISISLQQMSACGHALHEWFGKEVKFRALYIEKDPHRFRRLESYLADNPYRDVEVACFNGNYVDLTESILEWAKDFFTFFFVDPTGWKDISALAMAPLLSREKTEFLINLMYEFINRFVDHPDLREDMVSLFGQSPTFSNASSSERQERLIELYLAQVNGVYKGRASRVSIKKPGTDGVKYFLVYLTRNAMGLRVFKEVAEDMEIVQRVTQREVRLRAKEEKSGTPDLFGASDQVQVADVWDNREEAKRFILKKLGAGQVRIDNEVWADWLEESGLYPTDFQLAMRELSNRQQVKNLDAAVHRRRKKVIRPDWGMKSERWVLFGS